MAINFLHSFVAAVLSTTTVLVNAQTSAPLQFAGVNIAGFDFGCGTDGTCSASGAVPPIFQLSGIDGAGQMQHFFDDGYNVFRLPVGWQYLTNDQMTGVLDETQFANYNTLVSDCLSTGAYCLIDIHNYARYNGQVIGQGGPSNEVFAELWSNIASYWKNETKVIFGVMNEPHDIPNISAWAESGMCSLVRLQPFGKLAPSTQMILLPGTNYASAKTFVSSGSADALDEVKNPDGTFTNLIMDVHKYLDYDGSGTNAECVTNGIDDTWTPLATWLRANGRQALNSETGGGNVESCINYLSQAISYQASQSDVILGYIGWAAGSFATNYVLSQVPSYSGTSWNDTLLVSMAMSPRTNKFVVTVA
ncbi:glycoside hydrolase family 5 protein [Suillus fuscotomentosus]|uniref:cellulase n=1 Tax=Suillus fuscotomentosus TaxID=1912939 RepID=A0AAD4HP78_9AGAM|nr:glycoside hydrolase family 5 protein [Suillus fuscotomentosus]KAG1902489.1 glycoside hydrolase family 5 protein [Suillus fuscotomentosus]